MDAAALCSPRLITRNSSRYAGWSRFEVVICICYGDATKVSVAFSLLTTSRNSFQSRPRARCCLLLGGKNNLSAVFSNNSEGRKLVCAKTTQLGRANVRFWIRTVCKTFWWAQIWTVADMKSTVTVVSLLCYSLQWIRSGVTQEYRVGPLLTYVSLCEILPK